MPYSSASPSSNPPDPRFRKPWERRRLPKKTLAMLLVSFSLGAVSALTLQAVLVTEPAIDREQTWLSDMASDPNAAAELEGEQSTFLEPAEDQPAESLELRAAEFDEEIIEIQPRDTVSAALKRAGIESSQAHAIISALATQLDLRRVRPGHKLVLHRTPGGEVAGGYFESSPIDFVDLMTTDEGFEARIRELNLLTREHMVSVQIESSLWDAFIRAEEDPSLAVLASDVLAWEVDFYREVRRGDRLDLVVERITHDDQFVRYGNLLAVRYDGDVGQKSLFRWEHDEKVGWFDSEGRSARRPFLKQPLPLVRITSGFGGRRHPTLGFYKQHLGVDYGAPTGTRVWAVGDGVVTFAGWKGANGNLVTIRHANGYSSHYAHLSRIHVKQGQRVNQKDVIARVGSTGRSTGPHLHFAISKDGKFVNPLTVKMPAGDPLPDEHQEGFAAHILPLKEALDNARELGPQLAGAEVQN